MNEREDEGRDAEQNRDRQRNASREKPKQTSALCFVLVRAEHILRDRHVVEREAVFIERRLRIGIASGIWSVLDGAFLHVLVGLWVRALVHTRPPCRRDAVRSGQWAEDLLRAAHCRMAHHREAWRDYALTRDVPSSPKRASVFSKP